MPPLPPPRKIPDITIIIKSENDSIHMAKKTSIIELFIDPLVASYIIQGQWKLFITGQDKLNPNHYTIKCVCGRW